MLMTIYCLEYRKGREARQPRSLSFFDPLEMTGGGLKL